MKPCPIPLLAAALLLGACDRQSPPFEGTQPPVAARPSSGLVDELARDPRRLEEIRRQCREQRERVSEELCIASALAVRKRFMGDGVPRYTPEPVDLPRPDQPAPRK